MAPIKLKETEILRMCLDLLTAYGILHWRSNNAPIPIPGGGYRRFNGMRGLPDICGIVNTLDGRTGVAFFCEVKAEKGKLSEFQKSFHEEATNRGAIVCTVRSPEELLEDLISAHVLSSRDGQITVGTTCT
jgi:hypothetical protein